MAKNGDGKEHSLIEHARVVADTRSFKAPVAELFDSTFVPSN